MDIKYFRFRSEPCCDEWHWLIIPSRPESCPTCGDGRVAAEENQHPDQHGPAGGPYYKKPRYGYVDKSPGGW